MRTVTAHLSLAAVLLVSASHCRADIVTYSICDYPVSQAMNDFTYHVTCSTITIDTGSTHLSASGISIPNADITNVTLNLQTPSGVISTGLWSQFDSDLMASATQLYLVEPAVGWWKTWNLYYDNTNPNPNQVAIEYIDMPGGCQYYAYANDGTMLWQGGGADGSQSIPGQQIGASPMIIAQAVPEPTSITLLISGLLGLVGAFHLRRRATA